MILKIFSILLDGELNVRKIGHTTSNFHKLVRDSYAP